MGDVVLIKDVKPRMTWRKGRVEYLIEGKDGLVRGAEIKVYQSTKDNITILRPLQLIVPLELYEFDSNEPANQEGKAPPPRRMAAVNAELIRQLND